MRFNFLRSSRQYIQKYNGVRVHPMNTGPYSNDHRLKHSTCHKSCNKYRPAAEADYKTREALPLQAKRHLLYAPSRNRQRYPHGVRLAKDQ